MHIMNMPVSELRKGDRVRLEKSMETVADVELHNGTGDFVVTTDPYPCYPVKQFWFDQSARLDIERD